MVLRRGINGKLKLHPVIKYIGGVCFLVGLIVGGAILKWQDRIENCNSAGGIWVGGMLIGSRCEIPANTEGDW